MKWFSILPWIIIISSFIDYLVRLIRAIQLNLSLYLFVYEAISKIISRILNILLGYLLNWLRIRGGNCFDLLRLELL